MDLPVALFPGRLEIEQTIAIAALAAAIELHDVGTSLHLDLATLRILARASWLHDLGKLGIASSLLHKPSSLNEREWQIVKKHPTWGLEILSRIGDMGKEKAIILAHHEQIDGQGYPSGLAGDQIPRDALVMTLASKEEQIPPSVADRHNGSSNRRFLDLINRRIKDLVAPKSND